MSLEEAWNSAGNTPSADATATFVRGAFDRMRRRRRHRIALVLWTTVVLSGLTVVAFHGRTRAGAPGLGLILAAQWVVVLYWIGQLLRSSPGARVPSSIRTAVETLLRETEAERRGKVAVLVLFAVVVPLLGLAVLGLRQGGQMAPHEAASAAAVMAVVLALGLVRILHRLFGTILPRQRQLRALLADYAGGPSGA